MKFRTFLLINRVFAPLAFLLAFAGFALVSGPGSRWLQILLNLPFIALCVYGAAMGVKLQLRGFMAMRCPFCDQEGTVGRGSGPVGWWLSCDRCEIVTPRDWFGFRYRRQSTREYESQSSD